jgi:hypothetical protein
MEIQRKDAEIKDLRARLAAPPPPPPQTDLRHQQLAGPRGGGRQRSQEGGGAQRSRSGSADRQWNSEPRDRQQEQCRERR